MQVAHIRLQRFRNHHDTLLEFGAGTNILLGDNGQGKTNILEAISYLCLTKSFYAANDSVAVTLGENDFEVEGRLVSDNQVGFEVRVVYQQATKEKVYSLNKRRIEPFASVVGRFPIVVLSPEFAPVTTGSPADRRRFVDLVISQASGAYFENLLEYRRILKQRNKTLLEAKVSRRTDTVLSPWNEQLASVGAKLMVKRRNFVEEFQPHMTSAYSHINELAENPTIVYSPSVPMGEEMAEAEISSAIVRDLELSHEEELRLGTTVTGPHRDEFVFKINDMALRNYASQGQHKTFLISLKVGEFNYLKERTRETPLFLLDDVFSELDDRRTRRVLNFLGEFGQTFITSTSQTLADEATAFGEANRRFFIANGSVVYENA
jgi:DNA replication and repair protein RecF